MLVPWASNRKRFSLSKAPRCPRSPSSQHYGTSNPSVRCTDNSHITSQVHWVDNNSSNNNDILARATAFVTHSSTIIQYFDTKFGLILSDLWNNGGMTLEGQLWSPFARSDFVPPTLNMWMKYEFVPQKLGSCWGLPNNFVYWNLNLQKNIDVVLSRLVLNHCTKMSDYSIH